MKNADFKGLRFFVWRRSGVGAHLRVRPPVCAPTCVCAHLRVCRHAQGQTHRSAPTGSPLPVIAVLTRNRLTFCP